MEQCRDHICLRHQRMGDWLLGAFLPQLADVLSYPRGVCYMVAVAENRPADIAAVLARHPRSAAAPGGGAGARLRTRVVARRRARNERLMILRMEFTPPAASILAQAARIKAEGRREHAQLAAALERDRNRQMENMKRKIFAAKAARRARADAAATAQRRQPAVVFPVDDELATAASYRLLRCLGLPAPHPSPR